MEVGGESGIRKLYTAPVCQPIGPWSAANVLISPSLYPTLIYLICLRIADDLEGSPILIVRDGRCGIGAGHPLPSYSSPFYGQFLNAVISSFSLKSRRSLLVSVVLQTRSECLGVGFTSAFFKCDIVPVAIDSKFHELVQS
jgi:hypothetical protein